VNADVADRLAANLELSVHDIGICHACLSFVSMAIDTGDEREIRRETNRMTPDLWADGLDVPLKMALARARERGVPNVDDAFDDVADRGPRSAIAKAVVRRLGADLADYAKGNLLKMGFEPWPPPELR
jgi:hypothetical protein